MQISKLRDETGIPAIIELHPSSSPSSSCSSVEYSCWSKHFTAWTRWTGPGAKSQPVSFRCASPGTSSSTVNGSGYCPPATPASADFKLSTTNTSNPGIVRLLELISQTSYLDNTFFNFELLYAPAVLSILDYTDQ